MKPPLLFTGDHLWNLNSLLTSGAALCVQCLYHLTIELIPRADEINRSSIRHTSLWWNQCEVFSRACFSPSEALGGVSRWAVIQTPAIRVMDISLVHDLAVFTEVIPVLTSWSHPQGSGGVEVEALRSSHSSFVTPEHNRTIHMYLFANWIGSMHNAVLLKSECIYSMSRPRAITKRWKCPHYSIIVVMSIDLCVDVSLQMLFWFQVDVGVRSGMVTELHQLCMFSV